MKNFKDPITGQLFAYEDDADIFVKDGLVPISDEDVAAIHAANEAKYVVSKRIAELRALLSKSDYKVLPDYDKNNESIKTQRQAWREEIRTLEAQ
jgi:hypothetical protein